MRLRRLCLVLVPALAASSSAAPTQEGSGAPRLAASGFFAP